ncbi:MAG TPA: SulP family inorganic anion transporter [Pseudonocardia sp.]
MAPHFPRAFPHAPVTPQHPIRPIPAERPTGRHRYRQPPRADTRAAPSRPDGPRTDAQPLSATLLPDLGASVVVFLVALPLCVGVAVGSGAPAELGIITGIVGGLVAGALPGSSLQVSGPAAGLTVIVADAVAKHGLPALGVIVIGAGLFQLGLGLARLGTWFQAISPSVVQGMLAGIGLSLILGQIFPLAGGKAPRENLEKVLELPHLFSGLGAPAALAALGIGLLTLTALVVWPLLPARARAVPAPLVAVLGAALLAVALDLPAARVRVGSLADALNFPTGPGFALLADPAIWAAIFTFGVVASAESLFSAAAVDRLHDGKPTQYNAELMSQGAGNLVSGIFGALPMTAVIVRSAANVQAGARTKLSRILHGLWLLLFAVALPDLLTMVPLAALAALLIHSGWKLASPGKMLEAMRKDRAEGAIAVITAVAIFGVDMLTGVIVGLALAIALSAWRLSHLHVDWRRVNDELVYVRMSGNATFLRLPHLLRSLHSVPHAPLVDLDLTGVRHLDQATEATLRDWATQRRKASATVRTAPARAG